ncbi:MAG: acyltransferase [Eubacteriales bacterium]
MDDTKHSYGIDLLRIIAMLMVLFLHVLGQGGVYPYAGTAEALASYPRNFPVAWLMETAAFGAVDLFALISGYTGCNSKVKTGKFLKLYASVVFWGVLMVAAIDHLPVIFECLNYLLGICLPGIENTFQEVTLTGDSYIQALLPVQYRQYWYFNAYLLMYFTTPLLNVGIRKMSKGDLIRLDLGIVIILSVFPTLCNDDLFYTGYGYTGLWLIALYLIGGTVRRYPPKWKLPKVCALIGYALCTLGAWGCFMLVRNHLLLHPEDTDTALFQYTAIQYTSPFILFGAICLLLFASKVQFRNRGICGTLKFIAPATFAVYLIHVQPIFWNFYMLWRFKSLAYLPTLQMVGGVVLAVLILFALCILLERMRMLLFRLLFIDKLLDFVGSLLDKGIRRLTDGRENNNTVSDDVSDGQTKNETGAS